MLIKPGVTLKIAYIAMKRRGVIMGSAASVLGTVSLGSQIGGGVMSAAGAYGSAKSQKSALNYQASMADINARMAENNAQYELRKGNAEVASVTLQHGQLKGQQRAALAANGVDMGVGSAAEVQASSEILKDMDVNTLLSNAMRAAWGYRTESVNYSNEALMSRASAKSISPGMSGLTSLLGTAGSVANSWYKFNEAGVFDKPIKSLTKGKTLRKV